MSVNKWDCLTGDYNIANLQSMKRVFKTALLVSVVIVFALALLSFIYFVVFDTFTLVSDPALSQLIPSSHLSGLRMELAAKGIRLRVKTLDEICFYDGSTFTSEISRTKGDYVLLGPVSSRYAIQNSLDVSGLLPKSVVLGISSSGECSLFDCTLSSDESSGWVEAAKSVSEETSLMSQNVGLVYDGKIVDYSNEIISCFGPNRVSSFEQEDSGRLLASRTLDEMDQQGIVIVLCPYAANLQYFFSDDSSLSWVVDYRFTDVVPHENLYGVVLPDFRKVIETAKSVVKGERTAAVMEYCYEKR